MTPEQLEEWRQELNQGWTPTPEREHGLAVLAVIDEARRTIQRLNRRCQEAESALAEVRRMKADQLAEASTPKRGRPMGRMLANDLERQNADLRAALVEIKANGWCPCVPIACSALAGAPLPEGEPTP